MNIFSKINNVFNTTISNKNFLLIWFSNRCARLLFSKTLNIIKLFTFVCKTKAQDIGIQAMVPESNLSQTCKDGNLLFILRYIIKIKKRHQILKLCYLTLKISSGFPLKSLWVLPKISQLQYAPIRRNHMSEFKSQLRKKSIQDQKGVLPFSSRVNGMKN